MLKDKIVNPFKTYFQPRILQLKSVYKKYERFLPLASFFAGFMWDNLTLSRIDQILDNIILLFYIIFLGVFIVLITLIEKEQIKHKFLLKYKEWFPNILQFLFGGLFSAYVVFYFQSASLTKTSLFLAVLILLLIANEFLTKRLTNLYLLLGLYFLATFSFFIFFIPVATRYMNVFTFILGGLISLLILAGILRFLDKKNIFESRTVLFNHGKVVLAFYALLNVFYWLNWIPPVPLSKKDGAIYHHVSKQGEYYKVRYEKPKWYQFFKNSDSNFYFMEGDTVFCFVSVFAPTNLTKKILHHWQLFSTEKNEWISTDRAGYKLSGGREGGYRGYTFKRNIQPGEWRVDVITADNLLIGRIDFEIFQSDQLQREWKTELK